MRGLSSHNAWASDNTAAAGARGFVAAPGEHNDQVLRECLGWSRDSIEKLAAEGVLCGKRPEPGVEP
jgi:hypothetical protein